MEKFPVAITITTKHAATFAVPATDQYAAYLIIQKLIDNDDIEIKMGDFNFSLPHENDVAGLAAGEEIWGRIHHHFEPTLGIRVMSAEDSEQLRERWRAIKEEGQSE